MRARDSPITRFRQNASCVSVLQTCEDVVKTCGSRRTNVRRLVFDELPAREPRLDVVPVADTVAVAKLPAQEDLAAPAHRGEVDEPLVGILHVSTEVSDLKEKRVDLLRDRVGGTPVVRRLTALKVFEEWTHLR